MARTDTDETTYVAHVSNRETGEVFISLRDVLLALSQEEATWLHLATKETDATKRTTFRGAAIGVRTTTKLLSGIPQ